jgi:hypothetical protein
MTGVLISAVALLLWLGVIGYGLRLRSINRRGGLMKDRPHRKAVVIGLVVALVALPVTAGFVGWRFATCLGGGFDLGISREGGECVGITDGGYDFAGGLGEGFGDETKDALRRVEQKIADQNGQLAGPHVKVAMLAPFTSPLSGPRLVHELEGVAAAQRHVNADGRDPKVELVLGQLGAAEKQWERVVGQVIALRDDDVPLVAAIGLGLSQDELGKITGALSRADVAMVGDITTGSLGGIPGFHRVSYDNTEQFTALFGYLDTQNVDFGQSIVVRSADPADTYSRTAADQVEGQLESRTSQFDPFDFGGGNLDGQFATIARAICVRNAQRPPVLFYTGRSLHLSTLLQRLDSTPYCEGVKVVSASDAAVLAMTSSDATAMDRWGVDKVRTVLRHGKISLYYTPLADKGSLAERPGFKDLLEQFAAEGFSADDLGTGWAINSWDALHIAMNWVWDAKGDSQDAKTVPQHDDVRLAAQTSFHGKGSVPIFTGASGDFSFDADGNRVDQPSGGPPVVWLTGDGQRIVG